MTKRTDNRTVAKIWATGKGDAQSNNGQFFNRGNLLFSYGHHYVAGYIVPGYYLPKGCVTRDHMTVLVLINAKKVSPTTSKHTSMARQAAASLAREIPGSAPVIVDVPDLNTFVNKRLGGGVNLSDESQTKISADFERILTSHLERSGVAVPSGLQAIFASNKASV